jgi:osmoprotectant transport system permease protein
MRSELDTGLRTLALLLGAALLATTASAAKPVVVGSKVFTESVVLSEVATQLLTASGIASQHRRELGGTRVLWSAMLRGDIDCYPEYTGTLRAEIYAKDNVADDRALIAALARSRVWASRPLGFENTYVLGMRRDTAAARGIDRISALALAPELRIGLSNEFLERADGWPGLKAHYHLPQTNVRGLTHDLAYRGVASNALDVTDLYSTDPEIVSDDLIALADDQHFFPGYQALFVCRDDVSNAVRTALDRLDGRIDVTTMAQMNAAAKLGREPEARVAANFLSRTFNVRAEVHTESRASRIWQRTLEHLTMVFLSLTAAVMFAIPLGVVAFYRPALGRIVLGVVDVLQTVPALALLVFLIPVLGIGYAPAIVALFLYSLLPILRNTHTGLAGIPRDLRESAAALGLSRSAQLRYVELPLATRSILAGIKTAAVINVGTATLGALIGAGGYGQPILTGIRLDDIGLILEGAVPAAMLAIVVQFVFGVIEKRWVVES